MERESMEFDVVIVGGGPAGLSAAIKLRQLSMETETEISVCVLERDRKSAPIFFREMYLKPVRWMNLFQIGKKRVPLSIHP